MNRKSNNFNIVILLVLSVVLGFSLIGFGNREPRMSHGLEGRIEALLEKESFFLKGEVRSEFISYLVATAKDYEFDPLLILAIMKVESSFKPHAISNHGAIGLLQLKLVAAKEVASQFENKLAVAHQLLDPFTNVRVGIQYLSLLRDVVGSNNVRMLTAYNAGPTFVKRTQNIPTGYARKVLREYQGLLKRFT